MVAGSRSSMNGCSPWKSLNASGSTAARIARCRCWGCGEQVLCLEHASAVADPPPVRPAGEAEAAADGEILPVLKGVSDTCDGGGLVRLAAGQREACGLVAELVKCRGKDIPRVGDFGG